MKGKHLAVVALVVAECKVRSNYRVFQVEVLQLIGPMHLTSIINSSLLILL